jgi:hypothetical protein
MSASDASAHCCSLASVGSSAGAGGVSGNRFGVEPSAHASSSSFASHGSGRQEVQLEGVAQSGHSNAHRK